MKKKNKKVIIIIIFLLLISIIGTIIFINSNHNNNKPIKQNTMDEKTQNIIKQIKNNEEVMIYITGEKDKCANCEVSDININYYKKLYNLNIFTYNINKNEDTNYILKELNYNKKNISIPTLLHIKDGTITLHNEIAYSVDEIKRILTETKYINEEKNIELGKTIDEKEFEKLRAEQKDNVFLLLAVNKKSYELRITMNNIAKKYNINYYVIDFSKSSVFSILDQLEKINNKNLPKEIFITNNNKIIASIEGKNKNKIESFFKKNQIIID